VNAWQRAIATTFALTTLFVACDAPALKPARPSGRILVLGDSLSVSPSDYNNFPAILEARLKRAGLGWRVTNAGIRGDTTAGGVRRINGLLAANRPDILILALGANDGLRGLDITQMARNLTDVIATAKTQNVRVLLCGMQLPPINMLPYGRQFREAFQDIADEQDVAFLPFILDGVALDGRMNQSDGMHPNEAGAERIADLIWPYLDELIRD
jgi:acyl-CoA thioesterase-1